MRKGQRVLVEGRVQIRSYDAKDGTKRWITEVIADRFEFIERRDQWDNNRGAVAAPAEGGAEPAAPVSGFGAPVPDDEKIPF